MWKLLLSFFLLMFILQVECWKYFHFGRVVGGNLGTPLNTEQLTVSSDNDFPDLWFMQKLDHFNPNNEITWKQV